MSNFNPEQRLFIDGLLVDAENGRTYDVINPATEEVAGIVAAASARDADLALDAARRCFDDTDWSTNIPRRIRALTQLRDGLKAVAGEWRHQIVAESGCPIAFTHGPLLDSSIDDIDYSLKLLETYAFEREIEDMGSSMGGPARRLVCKEAAGVVVAITPWNAPMQTNLQKIIPALAAGCTVVLNLSHRPEVLAWFIRNEVRSARCRLVHHFLHAKVIWWTGQGAYIGSINLTDGAWNQNYEAGVFLTEDELDTNGMNLKLRAFFDQLEEDSFPLTQKEWQRQVELERGRRGVC